MMSFREKNWLWIFTWPFAHKNYTLVGKTLYYPKGHYPSPKTIKHEEVHLKQKEEHGTLWFIVKYLLFFPFFYNPFRYRMEYEAYKQAQGYSDDTIHGILSSYKYGWLKWR